MDASICTDCFQLVTADTLPCRKVAATCPSDKLGIGQFTSENVMKLRARLIASTVAVVLCSHIGTANELTVSKLSITPIELDGGSQVKFTGTIATVCADTSTRPHLAHSRASTRPRMVNVLLCLRPHRLATPKGGCGCSSGPSREQNHPRRLFCPRASARKSPAVSAAPWAPELSLH
jgi:hypothetical protein